MLSCLFDVILPMILLVALYIYRYILPSFEGLYCPHYFLYLFIWQIKPDRTSYFQNLCMLASPLRMVAMAY